jgi:hypothetical protein
VKVAKAVNAMIEVRMIGIEDYLCEVDCEVEKGIVFEDLKG